ncbi:MAG: MFS transporter [Thaumarchaeota archaeon]|nr:MFS transporter [Nitrososphaerota archaeon]
MNSLLLICIVTFFTYTSQSMLVPLIPLYANHLGYTATDIGLVTFANLIVSSVLSIPFGLLSDRIGRKRNITIGAALAALASVGFLYSQDLYMLLLTYTVVGIAHAAYGPGTMAYPADIGAKGDLVKAVSWSQTSRQLAFIFGPALGTFVQASLGYYAAFSASIVSMLVALALSVTLLPHVATRPKAQGKSAEFDVAASRGVFSWLIIAGLFAVFANSFSNGTFIAFVPLYAVASGIATVSLGLVYGAQAFTSALVRILVGGFIRRTRRERSTLAAAMMVGSFAMVSMGLMHTVGPIAGIGAMVGLAQGSTLTISTIILARVAPVGKRGVVLGSINTVLYAGMGGGPALTGLIIDRYGFDWGFKAAGIITLVGAVIFFVSSRKSSLRESSRAES